MSKILPLSRDPAFTRAFRLSRSDWELSPSPEVLSTYDAIWSGRGDEPTSDVDQKVKQIWQELLQKFRQAGSQPIVRYELLPLRGRAHKAGKDVIRTIERALDVVTLARHRKVGVHAPSISREFNGILFTDDAAVIQNLERDFAAVSSQVIADIADTILFDFTSFHKKLGKTLAHWANSNIPLNHLERSMLYRIEGIRSRIQKVEQSHNLSLLAMLAGSETK